MNFERNWNLNYQTKTLLFKIYSNNYQPRWGVVWEAKEIKIANLLSPMFKDEFRARSTKKQWQVKMSIEWANTLNMCNNQVYRRQYRDRITRTQTKGVRLK